MYFELSETEYEVLKMLTPKQWESFFKRMADAEQSKLRGQRLTSEELTTINERAIFIAELDQFFSSPPKSVEPATSPQPRRKASK